MAAQDEFEEKPSKSQLKRDATALRNLGKRLTELSPAQLQQLPITESVRSAIDAFRRLPNSHGARKRQLQFIGRQMRECDYDLVSEALERVLNGGVNPGAKKASHRHLVERVLTGGDQAINLLVTQYPVLDRQKLRQIYRACLQTDEDDRIRNEHRLLRYLNEVLSPE